MTDPGPASAPTPADLIDQLRRTWSSVAELGAQLSPAEWRAPTECPGWDVRAQLGHLVGTEAMLLGRRLPPYDGPFGDEVRNDIGKFNEAWIVALAGYSDTELLAEFETVTAQRLVQLEALDPGAWDADGDTPVGRAPYRRFMEIRVFDSWVHEQDMRLATGRPGHATGPAAERSLDEVIAALGFIVGKKSRAPEGSIVRFSVTGPAPRTVEVAVEGRARLVPVGSAGPATTTVTTDALTFVRLACGRVPAAACQAQGTLVVSGDEALGERIAATLAFTM